MYLHAGNSRNILTKRILGIFDTDNATVSQTTTQFLIRKEKEGNVTSAADEIPKSFILYEEKDGVFSVCFSQLSSASLAGRVEKTISDKEL